MLDQKHGEHISILCLCGIAKPDSADSTVLVLDERVAGSRFLGFAVVGETDFLQDSPDTLFPVFMQDGSLAPALSVAYYIRASRPD